MDLTKYVVHTLTKINIGTNMDLRAGWKRIGPERFGLEKPIRSFQSMVILMKYAFIPTTTQAEDYHKMIKSASKEDAEAKFKAISDSIPTDFLRRRFLQKPLHVQCISF